MDFEAEVERLLNKTEIPFRVIAEKCNVSLRYLYYYREGSLKRPDGKKTLRIYEYLSGRKVKAA